MDQQLKDSKYDYQGTDLLKDTKNIHKQTVIYNHLRNNEIDKFSILGHGIKSYFRMIKLVLNSLMVCSILFIPTLYFYTQGEGYSIIKGPTNLLDLISDVNNNYYLGNLGFTTPWCASFTLDNQYTFECGAGRISQITHVGITPDFAENPSWREHNFCGDHNKHPDIKFCTHNYLNIDATKKLWNE